jgi:hypothetical protein
MRTSFEMMVSDGENTFKQVVFTILGWWWKVLRVF